MNNHFKIIIPFYNVEQYISTTIKSVIAQNYKNYECILINDKSTDASYDTCLSLIENKSSFKLVNNEDKKCSLENIYDTIHNFTSGEDIIVILDGDDFLFGPGALEYLNDFYNKEKCLLTYGSYINLSNSKRGKFAIKLPDYIIENNQFRNYQWCTSHLRSFKSSLFKKIDKKDLCDENNIFFTITGDLAIMFPMLEMAGHRSRYINKTLYVWNDLNELNDHKKDNKKQMHVENILRGRNKYERINE